jgi:hypothetical protein
LPKQLNRATLAQTRAAHEASNRLALMSGGT